MKATPAVVERLRTLYPALELDPMQIWDLLLASRGLTVVMRGGAVLPLPMSQPAARQLLHMWRLETE